MLRKRQLQVELVKKPKSQDTTPDELSVELEGKTAIVGQAIQNSIKTIGWIVCAYVGLDTIRRVVDNATR